MPQGQAWRSLALRYGLGVALAGLGLAARLAVEPFFRHCNPFPTFLLAVLAVNWLCGLGPCLAALALGALAGSWFFIPPAGSFAIRSPEQWFNLLAYLILGLGVAFYGWARQRAERRLRAERKEHNAMLHSTQDLLEHRVGERTAELRQSLQSMREFTYSIAHNLFAPLRATHGFSELLLSRCGPQLGEQGREFAQRIGAAAQRMSHLLEALLLYGRVASSDAPLGRVKTAELVEESLRRVRALPEGMRGQFEVQPGLPPMQANPGLLAEVLFHLLHNAARFVAPEVTPRVLIRAEARNGSVRLCIQDNGIGIDPALHREVFSAFSQGDHADGAGTGMGLAIVQRAVERMHGKAGLESQPGQGSCFWLEFPQAD